MAYWTFFSNHSHVLFAIARNELITVRELSQEVGITDRFVHKILNDLEEEGYLIVHKEGRNNRYRLNPQKKLRHPVEKHIKIGKLINLVSGAD